MDTLANSEDQDKMHHNATFHQGRCCLLILKHQSGSDIHNKKICDFTYTIGSPIFMIHHILKYIKEPDQLAGVASDDFSQQMISSPLQTEL